MISQTFVVAGVAEFELRQGPRRWKRPMIILQENEFTKPSPTSDLYPFWISDARDGIRWGQFRV